MNSFLESDNNIEEILKRLSTTNLENTIFELYTPSNK